MSELDGYDSSIIGYFIELVEVVLHIVHHHTQNQLRGPNPDVLPLLTEQEKTRVTPDTMHQNTQQHGTPQQSSGTTYCTQPSQSRCKQNPT